MQKKKNLKTQQQKPQNSVTSILHTPDSNLKGICFTLGRIRWACLILLPAAIHTSGGVTVANPLRHLLRQPENLKSKIVVLKKNPSTRAFLVKS